MARSRAWADIGPVLHDTAPGDRSPAQTELRRMRATLHGEPVAASPARAGRQASDAAIEAAQRAAIASVRAEFWQVWCGVHPTKTRLADVGREYREGRA